MMDSRRATESLLSESQRLLAIIIDERRHLSALALVGRHRRRLNGELQGLRGEQAGRTLR
jgi:hypothetical protein